MSDRPAEYIPAALQDISEICGTRVALLIIDHFGGLDMRFPKNPPPDHPVLRALGDDDGRKVCAHFGGMIVSVPTNSAARRRVVIAKLRAEGAPLGRIARATGLTQRHVRRIVNEELDPRQDSLF